MFLDHSNVYVYNIYVVVRSAVPSAEGARKDFNCPNLSWFRAVELSMLCHV